MKFYVYILFSFSLGKFYKGFTSDIHARIKYHNNGFEKYTKKGVPWVLIWFSEKQNHSQAMLLESKLKNLSNQRLVAFIEKYNSDVADNINWIEIKKIIE